MNCPHQRTHLKKRVQAKPAEHTIIIFDWDDTLLPTSWLAAELGNDVQLWPGRLGAHRALLVV